MTHNESGDESFFEAGDDVWDIDVRMDMTSTFDDETSSGFSEEVARIYFEMSGFSLSPQSLNPDYDGPRDWDEYPNPPDRKPFFIQYGWRLEDGDDMLGAAGWLEPFIEPTLTLHHDQNNNRRCCQDFLFVIGERQFMPEPASGTLVVLAVVAMIGAIGRRRR